MQLSKGYYTQPCIVHLTNLNSNCKCANEEFLKGLVWYVLRKYSNKEKIVNIDAILRWAKLCLTGPRYPELRYCQWWGDWQTENTSEMRLKTRKILSSSGPGPGQVQVRWGSGRSEIDLEPYSIFGFQTFFGFRVV